MTLCICGVAGAESATLYTARVDGGAALSDVALADLAASQGSVETLKINADGTAERAILNPGTPGVGAPGFTSRTELAARAAGGASSAEVDGAVLSWPNGSDAADLVTIAHLNGKQVYTEYRVHGALGQLDHLRVDYANGSALYQIFLYGTGDAEIAPATAGEDATTSIAKASKQTFEKAMQSAAVSFVAPPNGVSYVYDTGFWPGGGETAGGFPVQVRLGFAATATYDGTVNGVLDYNKPNLAPGAASGNWGFDFGAEIIFKAAFDIGVIDPIVLNVPYVPNFDLRASDRQSFNNFLLDSTSTLHNTTPRSTLFTYDLASLILGGLNLPSWFPLSAGAALDVSIEANGDMTCDSISMNDGTTFTSEGQQVPITVPVSGYRETATYNENANLSIGLHAYPAIFIKVAGQKWDLPLFDFPWTPLDGPRDLAFSTSNFGINYVAGEGEGEGEGATEGEGEGEGEGATEGEGEGEGATEGEGEGEGEPDLTTDWLTEPFARTNDLTGRTIIFTPDASPNGYTACSDTATAYPDAPTPGTPLPLEDDGVFAINLPLNVPFFGTNYTRFFVTSNGSLTFGEGSTDPAATIIEHFRLARISGFLQDLDPSAGGSVILNTRSDRYIVTYDQVPLKGGGGKLSFQISLHTDGVIQITWLDVASAFAGVSGLSRGHGFPGNYQLSNLSGYVSCSPVAEGEGEGEGAAEGEGEGEGEGSSEGEGEGEGATEGEGEGEGSAEGEGATEGEGEGEGSAEGEGEGEGATEGEGEGEGSAEGEGEGEGQPVVHHSADQNGDGTIDLSELLRVIQIYNSFGYHCDAQGEDGFAPGIAGDHACTPHGSDYNPQDWVISLSELLRTIQFYNSGGYHACPGQNTEDGYCVGLA